MKALLFFKNKLLWLIVYALAITCVFLYLLFPSAIALQRLKAAALTAGVVLEAKELNPSLPLGLKFSDLKISSAKTPGEEIFSGPFLDTQLHPASFFQKRKKVSFRGEAYGGKLDGGADLVLVNQKYKAAQWKVNFTNIDLARCNAGVIPLIKGMTGQARGSGSYEQDGKTDFLGSGKFSLYLTGGVYPLPEPFLGVSRIEFDRGEIQAQLKNGVLTIKTFDIYGERMNCFFKGEIQLAQSFAESRLNLKGTLEIAGKSKVKMNIFITGTTASPLFRYM